MQGVQRHEEVLQKVTTEKQALIAPELIQMQVVELVQEQIQSVLETVRL